MKKYASLSCPLRTLAISIVLMASGFANAQWSISLGVPAQTRTQTQYYESTTIYGAPGAQIISTRQVPQTVCRPAWVGSNTQQCYTQFVTVPDNYVPQNPPVYIAPTLVYATPTFGYPGYSYNRTYPQWNNRYEHHGHDPRYNEVNQYQHNLPPSRTYVQPTYGIGSSPAYSGNATIQINRR